MANVEGIGPAQAAKLREAGVRTLEALLEPGATPKGCQELEAATGQQVADWIEEAKTLRRTVSY